MEWHEEQIEKYGFYVHYVPLSDMTANIHTHGLKESFSHPDLQIVIPIRQEQALGIFHGMVDQIKKGKRFDKEGYYDNVIMNYDVYLHKAKENGRTVMRVILPDKDGKFYDSPSIDNPYSHQKTLITN